MNDVISPIIKCDEQHVLFCNQGGLAEGTENIVTVEESRWI